MKDNKRKDFFEDVMSLAEQYNLTKKDIIDIFQIEITDRLVREPYQNLVKEHSKNN